MCCKIGGMPFLLTFQFLSRVTFVVVIIGKEIALHDVVGKLVVRIVQNCLQQLVEGELPELQCEFEKGCSCRHNFYGVAVD